MSHTAVSARPVLANLFPPLTAHTAWSLLVAGALADAAWEIWARLITPLWVGGPLQPEALVQSVFGFQSNLAGELIHIVVGVVFYPIGYVYVARPLARMVAPFLPWWVVGAGFGVGLWVFALYVMAHLFAGLPPFLGWVTLAYASLLGHMLFGVITAAYVQWRGV